MGKRTVSGVFRKNIQHNEPPIGVKTALRGNPLRSDGVDRTGYANQIPV